MKIIDSLIVELTQESAATKKLFERLPENKLGWKPHIKSMSLGDLASHMVESLNWIAPVLDGDEFVFDPNDHKPWSAASKEEILHKFEKKTQKALKQLEGRDDVMMMKPWRFMMGGRVIFELPRAAVLRSMIFNHSVHHRGQLTVYLRMLDVPLPAIYGPTADEPSV